MDSTGPEEGEGEEDEEPSKGEDRVVEVMKAEGQGLPGAHLVDHLLPTTLPKVGSGEVMGEGAFEGARAERKVQERR